MVGERVLLIEDRDRRTHRSPNGSRERVGCRTCRAACGAEPAAASRDTRSRRAARRRACGARLRRRQHAGPRRLQVALAVQLDLGLRRLVGELRQRERIRVEVRCPSSVADVPRAEVRADRHRYGLADDELVVRHVERDERLRGALDHAVRAGISARSRSAGRRRGCAGAERARAPARA